MSTKLSELRSDLLAARRDWANFKHPVARYTEAINQAIREAPKPFWVPKVNTSLSTIADTRRYALSGISDLTDPGQVLRVFIDDDDSHPEQIGRWEIENAAGVLTLVLDSDPLDASLTITIEYRIPYSSLTQETDTTTLDRSWAVAKAMTLLLLAADPEIDPPQIIQSELERWDAMRRARERQLLSEKRRRTGRVRSQNWEAWV